MSVFTLIGIIIIIIIIINIINLLSSMYKKVPPNRVLIVTGLGRKRVVIGGSKAIIVPIVQQVSELSLEAKIIDIKTPEILIKDKIPLAVQVVAIVKINGSQPEEILKFAEKFLGKTDQEIDKNIEEILEAHTKEVIARTSLQELLHNRESIVAKINKSVVINFQKFGLVMDACVIKDIIDTRGAIRLALSTFMINITIPKVPTSDRTLVSVGATATVKFNLDDLEKAADRFFNKKYEEVVSDIKEILESKIKEVIATVSSEKILYEIEEIIKKIKEKIKNNFTQIGLILDTFNLIAC